MARTPFKAKATVKPRKGRKGAAQHIREQGVRAGDLQPALSLFGAYMLRSTQKNFDAAGRQGGRRGVWPPLSERTKQQRRQGTGALLDLALQAKPLQDTGRLKSSITFDARSHVVEIGTNVEYAPDHQQGGNFGGELKRVAVVQVPAHTRPATPVAAHTRTTAGGKTVSVGAHVRPAHAVRAYEFSQTTVTPARPFLVFQPNDLDVGLRTTTAYLRGGLPAAQAAIAQAVP